MKGEITMLKRNLCGILLILAFGTAAAFAQLPIFPNNAKALIEQKPVLQALSVAVSKDLKQKVSFAAGKYKVKGNWAFVRGHVRDAQGGDVKWKITEYQKSIDERDFIEGIYALLKKTDGKWRVVTYLMNCSDVCYLEWVRQFKAPESLFAVDNRDEADYKQADALIKSGEAYLERKEYEKAIADYSKAVELQPLYGGAYYRRGKAYAKKKDYDKAIADYSNAVVLDNRNGDSYVQRGHAYLVQKQYDKAIADYSKAIEMEPFHSDVFTARATAYRATGKNALADADEKKAQELGYK